MVTTLTYFIALSHESFVYISWTSNIYLFTRATWKIDGTFVYSSFSTHENIHVKAPAPIGLTFYNREINTDFHFLESLPLTLFLIFTWILNNYQVSDTTSWATLEITKIYSFINICYSVSLMCNLPGSNIRNENHYCQIACKPSWRK